MVIGALEVRLLVRAARTLKDKRQVVRGILDRLRNRYNVSAAEVDHLDDHRQATIGVAAVGPDPAAVRGVLQTIQEALRRHTVAEYLGGELTVGRGVM